MKISEILKDRKTFSFEVFPPKMDKPMEPLMDTLNRLYGYEPDFISCTYGAGGTNVGRNLEVCTDILDAGRRVMTHFTCIGYRREGNEKVYDQLSRIAPTILAEHEWGNVKEALAEFGGILGREDKAAEITAQYEALASSSAEKIRAAVGAEEEVMFLQIRPKTYRIYGKTGQSKRILYNDLGLKPLENFPENEQWLDISMEGIFSYNPGHIVVDLYVDQGARDLFAELSKSRTWNNLDAVKRGNVYVVEDFNGSTIGPIGSMDIINKLTAQMIKQVGVQDWGDEGCTLCGGGFPPQVAKSISWEAL